MIGTSRLSSLLHYDSLVRYEKWTGFVESERSGKLLFCVCYRSVKYNDMDFDKIHGFARHFPYNENIELLRRMNIHSASNADPYNFHVADFQFFSGESDTII